MRKLIPILSALFLLYVGPSNAQDFMLKKDSLAATGGKGDIISPKTYVKNTSNDTLVLRWVRNKSNISSQWKKPGVCDKNRCYDNQDSSIYKLVPGDSSQMKINFYAYNSDGNGKNGEGLLNIKLYDTNKGYASGQIIKFYGETFFNQSSSGPESIKQKLKFYPNPVKDKLNINFPEPGQYKITLYNILGKPFKKREVSGKKSTTFELSELKHGTYVMKIISQGKEVVTKTFSKK